MTQLSRLATAVRQIRDDRVVRTAGGLIGSQIVIAVVSFAISLLSARVLGPTGRGELALYVLLAQVACVFCVLGAEQAYPAALTARPGVQQAGREVWRLVRWSTLLVVTAVASAIVIKNGATGNAWLLCLGFMLYVTGLVLLRVLTAASAAASSARRQLAVVVVWQLALLPVGGLLALLEVQSPGLWLCLFGATGVLPLAVVVFGRRAGRPQEQPGPDLSRARALGLRLIPATITNLLLLRAERFLIPWLASLAELGIYVVVATLTELIDLPMRYLLRAMAPDLADQIRTGRLRHRRILLIGLAYGVGGGSAVGVVVGIVLVPLFGAEYAGAVNLALPLGLAAGIYSFSRVGATICVAAHMPHLNTMMDLFGLVASVVGCLLLIPGHGATGATIATLVAYCLVAVVSVWCVRVVVRQIEARANHIDSPKGGPDSAAVRDKTSVSS
ncbi:lipopolysaccharide biosynthesis protein [Micromonospora maris]|uniref:lipopolysaccharide biosynthesis protein n=1 Tax=Micromonospora maris TaxID=1003110 RepID=UPI000206ABAD|nr:polysaccharide biosynthesis C-terminal domain-containing protein [Micromonospora maris]AEB43908.1 hypothetical protein VAB18032_13980 [Micromonospora maris AB-18-032]